MLDLPEMQNLLRQKRLRWVGHALRRKDGDLSKDTVKQELTRKSSTWTACVLSDMEALNIGSVVASEREANRVRSQRHGTSKRLGGASPPESLGSGFPVCRLQAKCNRAHLQHGPCDSVLLA